jgi:hypothetical protein
VLLRYERRRRLEVDGIWRVNLLKVVGPSGMKVVGFGCGLWRWYRGVGEIHMRVGEERGGKETDRCPLTVPSTP